MFLEAGRVGHLATADGAGAPHVVPVCYAATPTRVYIPVDEKPKRGDPVRLKRLRNIRANPSTAFVVDRYDDRDWTRLGWVMIRGTAQVIHPGAEHAAAIARLRDRYEQYRNMALDDLPVISIHVDRVAEWGRIGPAPPS